MSRRVLFVAYDFPPGVGIGGALRSKTFTEYLPEMGWEPFVFALDGKQAPQPKITRLPSLTPWRWPYEVTPYGWAMALHHHLLKLSDKFDLAYVSCPPFPQTFAVSAYSKTHGIPLVVDFRDTWALDPYQEGSALKRWLYLNMVPTLEKRLVGKLSHLILNTPSALAAYQNLYPEFVDKMSWLPNGFDGAAYPSELPEVGGTDLRLLYAGRFGIGSRTPANLLSGIELARKRGANVHIEILGDQPASLASHIAQTHSRFTTLLEQVPYEHAAVRMCNSSVLVLLQAPSTAVHQPIAGKTYDYLRAGRPILYIGPPGDNRTMIDNFAHRKEFPEDTPNAIADAIVRLHQDWKKGILVKGKVNAEFLRLFDRKALTKELAELFDRLIGK